MPSANSNWYRIEPRQRGNANAEALASRRDSIEANLAAQIRDPLWFLARQWQFGEFQGEDAASPVYMELKTRFSSIDGWRPKNAENDQSYDKKKAPLEARIIGEPFTRDWATAVELGQKFETLLKEKGGAKEVIELFRQKYSIPNATRDKLRIQAKSQKGKGNKSQVETYDLELNRFLLVCGGRAIDGIKLYVHARDRSSELQELMNESSLSSQSRQIGEALEAYIKWVNGVFGDFGEANLHNFSKEDPLTWRPERLEYSVEVSASAYDKQREQVRRVHCEAYPGRDGNFDWYTFDQKVSTEPGNSNGNSVKTVRVMPTYVQFRGMPNKRWWQFENGQVNIPSIQTDLVELAKLILVDFILVHSNDWFVIPFAQEVGTLCQVDSLKVYDVFGGTTYIERAEEIDRMIEGEQYDNLRSSQRWSMFSITVENSGQSADFFILPPGAAMTTFTSEPVEEMRFIRDEMANMVWAIEYTTENGIGMPWPGDERSLAKQTETDKAVTSNPGVPLKYQIQTTVPEHWIPFLPVHIDNTLRDIALERAAMLDDNQTPVSPVGRILNPTRLNSTIHDWNGRKVYRIREEEVPRTGVRVSRVVRRSRWIDGSTHLWIARRKKSGAGEGSSGLRFDIAVPTPTRG